MQIGRVYNVSLLALPVSFAVMLSIVGANHFGLFSFRQLKFWHLRVVTTAFNNLVLLDVQRGH